MMAYGEMNGDGLLPDEENAAHLAAMLREHGSVSFGLEIPGGERRQRWVLSLAMSCPSEKRVVMFASMHLGPAAILSNNIQDINEDFIENNIEYCFKDRMTDRDQAPITKLLKLMVPYLRGDRSQSEAASPFRLKLPSEA